MTKISDLSALTGATVDAANDLVTVVDMSETGAARNKKMTFAELLKSVYPATPSQGDVIYYNGTAWVRLAAGTAGQFLKTLGAGANPAWATATVSPSVQAVTSSATVTPTFNDDGVKITAQATALNLANPTGTPVSMWGWAIRIKDNGTARAITYGTQYRAIGVTLPTTTVVSKTLYLGCIWNNDDSKVDVVSVAPEA